MKLQYLGTFYINETHSMDELSPYEQTTDVLTSDRDSSDHYPLDEIVRANTAWTGDLNGFHAVYQENYSQVLFKAHGEDFKAWRQVS